MAATLEEILSDIGPCLTTTLTKHLIDQGLSPEAARQRVSRARNGIRRTPGLSFPNKAKFIYHEKDFNSDQYWNALIKAIINDSPSYGPALAALVLRDGLVPKPHFDIICGCPKRQKKQISSDNVLERFNHVGITKEIDVSGIGPCIITGDRGRYEITDLPIFKARLIAEDILLNAVRDWARKLGLGSYDKIKIRDTDTEQPRVGTFHWDMTGPSYLAPMIEWTKTGKPKPGFLVCDVFLGTKVDKKGLEPFLRKFTTLRNLKMVGRTLAMFIADSYTEDAFKAARQNGVIAATPTTLFGREVAEGLNGLIATLAKAAEVTTRPEVFDELFRKLGHIEGAANNLRGALFELIVADLVRTVEGGRVRINHIVRDTRTEDKAEIDVLLEQEHRKLTVIECKGYQPSTQIDAQEIEKWLTNRIPLIRKCALAEPQWQGLKLRFEYWTTGRFSPEAQARLEQAAAKTTKYEIHYKDSSGVKEYAQKLPGSPLLKTLNEHFFQHPLTKIEEKAARDLGGTTETNKEQ